jgi:hypothetical protein
MSQDNTDFTNATVYLGLCVLIAAASTFSYFFGKVGQKVYIKPNLTIVTDTIFVEESRWYYESDTAMRDIRISLYKEKGGTPYDVLYLEPDDFVDLKLKEGYNIVHFRTLGKYPTTHTRCRVLQLKPTKIPPPKFSFKRLFDY